MRRVEAEGGGGGGGGSGGGEWREMTREGGGRNNIIYPSTEGEQREADDYVLYPQLNSRVILRFPRTSDIYKDVDKSTRYLVVNP